MMRLMLMGMTFYLLLADAIGFDLGLGPGLSIKNAILYLMALTLLLRIAVDRSFKLEQRGLHLCFAIMIGYALVTYLNAVVVMDLPNYDPVDGGIKLKSKLIDHFIFFAVFFYGARSLEDGLSILKAMLLAVAMANFIAVSDSLGLIDFGLTQQRADGRVGGAIGESNQYAAFVLMFLPAMLAAFLQHRGAGRLVWGGALLVSAMTLLMTVSRGAFVGVFVGGVWAVYLLRRHLSPGRIAAGAGAVVLLLGIVVLLLSAKYGALLESRVFGQTGSIDLTDASSGRTEIWTDLVVRMMQTPISLITGFGWNVYWSMPFYFSPHNHYLNMWFNLGLVGLIVSILMLAIPVRVAKAALDALPEDRVERNYLMGYIAGVLALAVAVFFVDLFQPWWYFWAFTGVMMRIAIASQEAPAVVAAPVPKALADKPVYGWVTTPRS